MATETATNYLGRCPVKDCDFAFFATSEDVRSAADWSGVKVNIAARVAGGPRVWTKCPNHKNFMLERVQGTFSEVHKCDSRCLNARGTTCTCSCGGANHGRGHAATHVAVASHDPAVEAAAHLPQAALVAAASEAVILNSPVVLPEVGATIKSNVEVTGKREGVGQWNACLYTFRTDRGGIVKWFAPDYLANFAEVGDKLRIRAEVKAHDEFRGQQQIIVKNVEKLDKPAEAR